jgi:ABC-type uncharacterized transport system permease subunit
MILLGIVAVAVAMPFGRREDWLGWTVFLTMAAVAAGLWGLVLCGFARAILQRRRSKSD